MSKRTLRNEDLILLHLLHANEIKCNPILKDCSEDNVGTQLQSSHKDGGKAWTGYDYVLRKRL